MALNDLSKAISRSSQGLHRINEVCLIGLISYFEAFCKDHFASILNIEPTLLESLRDNGKDTLIDPSRLLEFQERWRIRLGFLVAEKFDFGTAKNINSLYGALLKITPFSKSEIKYYEELLRDRNLLVHHGGIFTQAYFKQNSHMLTSSNSRPFYDSLTVSAEYFDERIDFIKGIAKKLLKSTHSALHAYIEKSGADYSPGRMSAVDEFIVWGGDGKI